MNIENKVILISGAGGIFGTEIVKYLLKNKATVIAFDIKSHKKMNKLIKIKNKSFFTYFVCDACDEKKLKKINNFVKQKYQKIDVLINLASITDPVEGKKKITTFENFSAKSFVEIVSKNLLSTFLTSKIFGNEMSKNKNGSIINFSSTYGVVGPDQSIYESKNKKKFFIKNPAYPTSKGGIISFTKYLASYWGNKNVRVNCIVPGGALNNQNKIFINNYSRKTPLGRMANKNDLNGIVHLLCSNEALYITGSIMTVDGGWTSI